MTFKNLSLVKKKGGRTVHSMEHIVVCSAIFGKAEAV